VGPRWDDNKLVGEILLEHSMETLVEWREDPHLDELQLDLSEE